MVQGPIAFTLSLVHPFLVGVLLPQVSSSSSFTITPFALCACFFTTCLYLYSQLRCLYADVTVVALEWAEKNVKINPHISDLIEIRDSRILPECSEVENSESEKTIPEEAATVHLVHDNKSYIEPALLLGVVKENETFDFCMSNPPFFETFEEAGLNPKTSCGGTPAEMVCNGGEQAFVSRIIEDSSVLRQRFR